MRANEKEVAKIIDRFTRQWPWVPIIVLVLAVVSIVRSF